MVFFSIGHGRRDICHGEVRSESRTIVSQKPDSRYLLSSPAAMGSTARTASLHLPEHAFLPEGHLLLPFSEDVSIFAIQEPFSCCSLPRDPFGCAKHTRTRLPLRQKSSICSFASHGSGRDAPTLKKDLSFSIHSKVVFNRGRDTRDKHGCCSIRL